MLFLLGYADAEVCGHYGGFAEALVVSYSGGGILFKLEPAEWVWSLHHLKLG